ncbi:MAG TPA: hypothetical protein VFE89_04045 [Beijerinckiaceae bacterium]|nr:hypothetical protein [Beijerinckiaceae bacterium]
MRHFYEDVLGFQLQTELSPNRIEYRVGNNTLVWPSQRGPCAHAGRQRLAPTRLQAFRLTSRSMR